jgi:GDP-4-dehydro-6-deoxy-D-mannose reductase
VRALVTGADGFVGRWLTEHLERAGDEVWQATGMHAADGARRRQMDLRDGASVREVLAWASPEAIYHLAAVSFGPDASGDIGQAIDVTVRGTAFLLEALAESGSKPTVLVPSSSEVYGAPPEGGLIDEAQPIAPVSPYGATKVAQEALGLAYHRSGAVPVVVARAFNHIGPGQRESFVVPSFAAQLAEIAAGRAEPIVRVGNLAVERDFSDVRDVVRAYRLLVAGGHTGVPVNVASGHAIAVSALLQTLIELSGQRVEVVVDPARLRPVDVPVIRGDSGLLRSLTGWQPNHDLGQTLHDVWADAVARRA